MAVNRTQASGIVAVTGGFSLRPTVVAPYPAGNVSVWTVPWGPLFTVIHRTWVNSFTSVITDWPAQITFAGSGAFSTKAFLAQRIAATFAGSGALLANTISAQQASVAFAGSASFFAYPINNQPILTSFNGAGSLLAAPTLRKPAVVTFNTSAAFSADAANPKIGEVRFDGAGSTLIDTVFNQQAFVRYAAAVSGSFYANAFLNETSPITMSPAGGLFAKAFWGQSVSATFAGSGLFSANAFSQQTVTVTFNGAGLLSATAAQGQAAQVTLAGAGALIAFAVAVPQATAWDAQATFNGAGSLRVIPQGLQQAIARFAGAGAFSPTIGSTKQLAATFAGAGLFTPAPFVIWTASLSIAGVGSFSASAANSKIGVARFIGAGSLQALVNFKRQMGVVNFDTVFDFTPTPVMHNFTYATFAGAGDLNAYANLIARASATFQGLGSLEMILHRPTNFMSVQFVGSGSFLSDGRVIFDAVNELSLQSNRPQSTRFVRCDIMTKSTRYLYLLFDHVITNVPQLTFSAPDASLSYVKPPKVEIGTVELRTCRGVSLPQQYLKCELDVTRLLSREGVWSVSSIYDGPGQKFYVSSED